MRKLLILSMVAMAVLALSGSVVFAAGKNGPAGKSDVGHVNIVEKDSTWAIIRDAGKLRYKISGTTLDVVLNATGLVPGNWYYVELVDVSSGGYDVIDDHWPDPPQVGDASSYSRFYAQANGAGNVHMSFSWTGSIASGMAIEANIKNADNVALLDPSAYGVPAEWILGTGQGWDHVLYNGAPIAIP